MPAVNIIRNHKTHSSDGSEWKWELCIAYHVSPRSPYELIVLVRSERPDRPERPERPMSLSLRSNPELIFWGARMVDITPLGRFLRPPGVGMDDREPGLSLLNVLPLRIVGVVMGRVTSPFSWMCAMLPE